MERNEKGFRFKLNRDRAGYHLSTRDDAEAVVHDPLPRFDFPDFEPLRFQGALLQLDSVSYSYKDVKLRSKQGSGVTATTSSLETAAGKAKVLMLSTASKSAVRAAESEHDRRLVDEDDGAFVLKRVCMSIDANSRVALVGRNGEGKTTLLNLLHRPDAMGGTRLGRIHQHTSVRVGYFSQHLAEQLDASKTAVELMQERFPGETELTYRKQLGNFGITGKLPVMPVGRLSGGQRARVLFSLTLHARPHVLLLDEPTHSLDLETIELLIKEIEDFQGGVVLVSHDQRLVEAVAAPRELDDGKVLYGDVLLLQQAHLRRLDGGYDEYREGIRAELGRR